MKHTFLIAGAAAFAVGAFADAASAYEPAEGRWLVRGRVIGVLPDDSASIDPIGGTSDISDRYVPELDITYFFTNNLAAELILGVTPHDVKAVGTALGEVDLGEVTLLPPTLTLQYHFETGTRMKPYIGAGVNYTTFFNDDLPSGTVLTSIDYDDSFGLALQAGVDIKLDNGWLLNFDVKRIDINTDVTIDAQAALSATVNADVDINPWVVGVGLGRRF